MPETASQWMVPSEFVEAKKRILQQVERDVMKEKMRVVSLGKA